MICLCVLVWFCYRCCWKVYYADECDECGSHFHTSRHSHSGRRHPDLTISKIDANSVLGSVGGHHLSQDSECDSEKVSRIIEEIEK